MNTRFLNLLPILFSTLTVHLYAQEPLRLDEALELAKSANLQLRQQSKSRQIARLEEQVQRANMLPALDLSLTTAYLSEINQIDLSQTVGIPGRRVELGGHDRSELTVGIRQPVFTGFRLKSQVDLAENAALSEDARLQVVTNEVCHGVTLLFYRAQSLYRQRKILQASWQRLDIQLENVRNLFEAKQVMAFDTLQVYNQTLALRIERQKTERDLRINRLQVARLLGSEETRPVAELTLSPPDERLPETEALQTQAFAQRPELTGVRLGMESARVRMRLARSAYYPTIYGQANFHYAKPGLDPVTNEWMDYFSVGVNLQWNLWRWHGDRRKIEEFEVTGQRLELQEQDLKKAIEIEVAETLENLKFSLNEWQLAGELLQQQQERYRIVEVQHRAGVASTNDLVTAEVDLTRAELQTELALVRYYVNLADLRKATGTISEDRQ